MYDSSTILIVVIVVILVILIIWFLNRNKKGGHSSRKSTKVVVESSEDASGMVSYQEYRGRSVNNQRPEHEFPRVQAQAARKPVTQPIQETEKVKPMVQAPQQPKIPVRQEVKQEQPKQEVRQEEPKKQVETVFVRNIAELFSPKENIEEELGVSEEQLQRMVAEYKKTKEHVERKLPINRHFDMDKYTQATRVIRESSVPQKGHGDKKGKIVTSIYKKYGKHFTTQKMQGVKPEVKATTTTPEQHQQAVRNAQGKSSKGKLATRIV
jgi:hypothetical protein